MDNFLNAARLAAYAADDAFDDIEEIRPDYDIEEVEE